MWYVMKPNSAYLFGFEKIQSYSTKSDAKKLAKNIYNSEIWSEKKYERWYIETVAPHYTNR